MTDLRAVCHIPSVECLIYHDLEHWITQFETRSGVSPTDVVLPAITATAVSYSANYCRATPRLRDANALRSWSETLRVSMQEARRWALVDLQLSPLANDMIALRDQWNQPMSRTCCIINPHVQEMLLKIFSEVRERGVDGIVLDLTDIYPNSTSDLYPLRRHGGPDEQSLQNSCFCKYCLEGLSRTGRWTEGAKPFKSPQSSIARFVLQPSYKPHGGTDPLTLEDRWLEKLDAADLVDFAYVRGFIEIDSSKERQKAIDDAAQLLSYMAARAKVTAQGVKRLHHLASQQGLSTAVILGSDLYDQTQNVNLSTLLNMSCSDEYWVETFGTQHLDRDRRPDDPDDAAPTLLRVMASRGTYYINSVFEYLESATRFRTVEQDDPILDRLCETGRALDRRDQLDPGQVAQIGLFKGLQGFVGVPFVTSDLLDIVQRMAADASLTESVKNEIVTKLGSTAASLGATESGSEADNTWE